MQQDFLIPECHYEQELLLILGFSLKNDINKAVGCNGVITTINKGYKGKLAIGWIDQDPTKQSNRHPEYVHYKQIESKHKVVLKKRVGTKHFLIEIQDEFEVWFEPIGKAKGIKKEDHKIKNHLHEYSRVKIPSNVKGYLQTVVAENNAPFQYIRDIIQNILDDKYQDN